MKSVNLYPVHDGYSKVSNCHGSFNSNAFVIENNKITPLKESPFSVYENIENFIDHFEVADFDIVAYGGTGIVFIEKSNLNLDLNKLIINVYYKELLTDSQKELIKSRYENTEFETEFYYFESELNISLEDFPENINEYDGSDMLFQRFSKSDIEQLVLKLNSKLSGEKL